MRNAKYAGKPILLLLILGLCSCGGQASTIPDNNPNTPQTTVAGTLPRSNASLDILHSRSSFPQFQRSAKPDSGWQSNAELPGTLAGVGQMPRGRTELPGRGQKIVSAVEQLDPTIVYSDSGDLTINVSSVSFSPGPGILSWAMYQLNLPEDGYPASISLTFDSYTGGAGPQQGYYILVSNYTTGRWLMSSRYTDAGTKFIALPTIVGLDPQNYLSPMNNLYVAVLAYDDVQLELSGFSQNTNMRPQALIVETSNTYTRLTTDEFQFSNESQDGDGTIVSLSWDYDADDIEDSTAGVVNVTYDTPGIHEIRLTAFDDNGGWDRDSLFVYTYDSDDSSLPDEFMAALNEGDPDPLPDPDIPLPELNYDQTFEFFFNAGPEEWWEIPNTVDNIQWKFFTDNDGFNDYSDMRCFLPDFGGYYYDDHTQILPFTDALRRTVDNWTDMQGIMQTTAALHGVGVVNEGIVLEVTDNDPLAEACKRLMNQYPGLADPSFALLQAEAADVPDDFQRAVARLINAIREAKPYHEAFLDPANTLMFAQAGLTPEEWHQLFFDETLGMVVAHNTGGPVPAYMPNLLNTVNCDYADLFQGAAVLTAAIDEFHAFLDGWTYVGPSFEFNTRTSLGNIRITGDGADVIGLPDWEGMGDGWYLLQIDTGGDDDYLCHAGGNAALGNPISICIDYSGNDEYLALDDPNDVDRTVVPSNDDTHQQGSGRMGYGLLLDIAGNDIYNSVRLSQGCSNFGVGILYDVSGDDTYNGEAMCQGASLVGIGVLFDEDGLDTYNTTAYSQGFGSFRGIGIIANHGIDSDSYIADTALNSDRPEYENGTEKLSYCQGVGRGRLPSGDATINPVGSGGLGMLCDQGGNDSYTAAVFGQGAAVFEGTGILLDLAGDDTYTGQSGCAGASVYRAVGILHDYAGSDDYLYSGELNLGSALNYSVGWLLDDSGDDQYEADRRSMGLGEVNSFAYFIDYLGTDSYELFSTPMRSALGSAYIGEFDASGFQDTTPTLGLFLDISGLDTYTLPENVLDRDGNILTVADDSVWVRSKHSELEPGWHDYEYGIGADGNWP